MLSDRPELQSADGEESEVISAEVLRYAAFTETPEGGNPAGVVLDARGLSDARMLMLAAEVGYSETAFLSPRPGGKGGVGEYDVRYFSPEAEVPFCGHATIATAVALAERDGTGELVFHIAAGPVPVRTTRDVAGGITATLTSVVPRVDDVVVGDVESALGLLGWSPEDLDPALPPKVAFAGARHLILAARSRERLAEFEYDFEGLVPCRRGDRGPSHGRRGGRLRRLSEGARARRAPDHYRHPPRR